MNTKEPVATGTFDPSGLLRQERKITGMSAILLPFLPNGSIDWRSFESHLARTVEAGLVPAVNMDTGYVNLLDPQTQDEVLDRTSSFMAGRHFVAGAFVDDAPGSKFQNDSYCRQLETIQASGGEPIVFQSYGMTTGSDQEIIDRYARLGQKCDRFLAFELGSMFADFGKIYSMDVYRGLLNIPTCRGAKHSSLQRELEWNRIELRNELRPEFLVLTGNDLAIDMVMYGSDYLLGLSTFCPDIFAARDEMWRRGDSAFYELNDILQYLGFFAFRGPTSAYKHTAAMFLHQRGWISSQLTHPLAKTRPESDRAILYEIGVRLGLDMTP